MSYPKPTTSAEERAFPHYMSGSMPAHYYALVYDVLVKRSCERRHTGAK